MLCFNCSLKNECQEICEDVNQYLKSKRNYKTTYVNKEIGISDFVIDEKAVMDYQDKERSFGNSQNEPNHEKWEKVMDIVSTQLTEMQETTFSYYLDGQSMPEIGRKMNVSAQTVHSTIFGHHKHGGGAARKIRKVLNHRR